MAHLDSLDREFLKHLNDIKGSHPPMTLCALNAMATGQNSGRSEQSISFHYAQLRRRRFRYIWLWSHIVNKRLNGFEAECVVVIRKDI